MSGMWRPTREQADDALGWADRHGGFPMTLAAEVRALRAENDRAIAAHALCDSAARNILDWCDGNFEPDELFNPPSAAAFTELLDALRAALVACTPPAGRIADPAEDLARVPAHTRGGNTPCPVACGVTCAVAPAVLSEDDERDVQTALHCTDVGDAGHWPTAAGVLACEVRRLRGLLDKATHATEWAARWTDGGYCPSNPPRSEEFARQHARMFGTTPIRRTVGQWVVADTGELAFPGEASS